MIYLQTSEGQYLFILEPGNIDAIQRGKVAFSNDRLCGVAYTPDAEWLYEQIMKNIDDLTPQKLEALMKEGLKRPKVYERKYHPTMIKTKEKKHE